MCNNFERAEAEYNRHYDPCDHGDPTCNYCDEAVDEHCLDICSSCGLQACAYCLQHGCPICGFKDEKYEI